MVRHFGHIDGVGFGALFADREFQLGVLKRQWGEDAIDRIDTERVVGFERAMLEDGKSIRTVIGYLDALSLLFQYHAEKMPSLENPVPAARKAIARGIDQTASFRAMNELNCNPVTPEDMGKLIAALDRKGNQNTTMLVLLCYDGGLRLGEGLGLQWGDLWWGTDEDDTTRHVHIQRARSGNRVGPTKSGRSRKVSMSRRLRSRLMTLYMERGRPDDEVWVLEQSWEKNIRDRIGVCAKLARIRAPKVKDLRDTYGLDPHHPRHHAEMDLAAVGPRFAGRDGAPLCLLYGDGGLPEAVGCSHRMSAV